MAKKVEHISPAGIINAIRTLALSQETHSATFIRLGIQHKDDVSAFNEVMKEAFTSFRDNVDGCSQDCPIGDKGKRLIPGNLSNVKNLISTAIKLGVDMGTYEKPRKISHIKADNLTARKLLDAAADNTKTEVVGPAVVAAPEVEVVLTKAETKRMANIDELKAASALLMELVYDLVGDDGKPASAKDIKPLTNAMAAAMASLAPVQAKPTIASKAA